MIERRSILKCLIGAIAAPAIIKVAGIMPVRASLQPAGISMRSLVDYVPGDQDIERLDMLYGFVPDGSIRLGDTITWEGESRGPLRQFVVTATNDADRMISYASSDSMEVGRLRTETPWITSQTEGGLMFRSISKSEALERWPAPSAIDGLALAAAAVAIAPTVLKTPVTRRFWSTNGSRAA